MTKTSTRPWDPTEHLGADEAQAAYLDAAMEDGDPAVITAALGSYIVWEGRNLGMSRWQLLRMAGNVGMDTLIGALPVVGDAADFLFRSNSRNLKIIKRHLDRHHPETRIIDAQPVRRQI